MNLNTNYARQSVFGKNYLIQYICSCTGCPIRNIIHENCLRMKYTAMNKHKFAFKFLILTCLASYATVYKFNSETRDASELNQIYKPQLS